MLRASHALRLLHRRAPERPIALDERPSVISVFHYGAGNLQSVKNALGALGAAYELYRDAASVDRAHKITVPGVGHFGAVMRPLDAHGVRAALTERIGV